jgi:hypothetical protein
VTVKRDRGRQTETDAERGSGHPLVVDNKDLKE